MSMDSCRSTELWHLQKVHMNLNIPLNVQGRLMHKNEFIGRRKLLPQYETCTSFTLHSHIMYIQIIHELQNKLKNL